jgi:hypothetical protein
MEEEGVGQVCSYLRERGLYYSLLCLSYALLLTYSRALLGLFWGTFDIKRRRRCCGGSTSPRQEQQQQQEQVLQACAHTSDSQVQLVK